MAKAQVKRPKTKKKVILTLSKKEARELLAVLGNVVNSEYYKVSISEELSGALDDAGVREADNLVLNGTITIKSS